MVTRERGADLTAQPTMRAVAGSCQPAGVFCSCGRSRL